MAMKESKISKNKEICFEIAKTEFVNAGSRMKDVDNKLNMLLVLVSALIVGIGTTVTLSFGNADCAIISLTIIIMLLIVGSIIQIVIGLFFTYFAVNPESLINDNIHELDSDNFYNFYLSAYEKCIKQINLICKRKRILAIVSSCLLIASFVLLMVIIVMILL